MPEPEEHPSTQPEREEDQGPPSLPAGLADERFAANVREQRELKKLSQGELARRMAERGFPYYQQTVRRIEDGRRKVSVGEAAALAGILGTTVERLTWPGQAATAGALLDMYVDRAFTAKRRIARSTQLLLEAQEKLEPIVAKAEQAAFHDSDKLQRIVREARAAMAINPERLVAAVRDGSYLEDEVEEPEPRSTPQEREG